MHDMQDKELVQRTLEGNQSAFGVLVERYQGLTINIARKYVRTEELAEDVAQEAFIRAYEALDRLREPAHFAHWLARITRNISLNHQRQCSQKMLSIHTLEKPDAIIPPVPAHDHTRAELLQHIRDLVQNLPEVYRQVFEMRYSGDSSCQAIADFLGVSQGTVITRLYRARKLILESLQKEGLA